MVDVTTAFLGEKYKKLTNRFEMMRRKRNNLTYEAGTLVSRSEAKESFADAIELVKKILKKVKADNPQLELKFSL